MQKSISFKLKVLLILLLQIVGVEVPAQNQKGNENLAKVYSLHGNKTGKAAPGELIFKDNKNVFKELPSFLSGTTYCIGSMINGDQLIPSTTGILYIITPLKGQAGSQEETLISDGFKRLDYPSFTMFKGQKEKIGIFHKELVYKSFRLSDVQFSGWAVAFFSDETLPSFTETAIVSQYPEEQYALSTRKWQGCPSIEKTGDRLWATWFSGGAREPDEGNYGIISFSDDGKTWKDPAIVIYHPNERVRVMDTQLWKDPEGKLWIFWTQNTGAKGFDGIWGTWAVVVENPEEETFKWSEPRRLCDGLTRNKPIVLTSGEWLLPSYDWVNYRSTVYVSNNNGKNWKLQGGPVNEPIKNFYEHMVVELKDNTLLMMQRDIKRSFSKDNGVNWSPLEDLPEFHSANSRLFLGRLKSGNLLLVYNEDPDKNRKNLTAYLSQDDGKNWPYKLMIDERDSVSYPDVVQDDSHAIHLIYDRSRRGEKEILMSTFTEEDIINGKFGSENCQQKRIISKP